nr:ATP-binding protein [Rhodococcus kroppenstedtii]
MDSPFARWGDVFGEATIASAMIDRTVHRTLDVDRAPTAAGGGAYHRDVPTVVPCPLA